jgi:hypothetical protein
VLRASVAAKVERERSPAAAEMLHRGRPAGALRRQPVQEHDRPASGVAGGRYERGSSPVRR